MRLAIVLLCLLASHFAPSRSHDCVHDSIASEGDKRPIEPQKYAGGWGERQAEAHHRGVDLYHSHRDDHDHDQDHSSEQEHQHLRSDHATYRQLDSTPEALSSAFQTIRIHVDYSRLDSQDERTNYMCEPGDADRGKKVRLSDGSGMYTCTKGDELTATKRAFLTQVLVPDAVSWWQQTLSVRPVQVTSSCPLSLCERAVLHVLLALRTASALHGRCR